ncbi:FkbM family methyltransferase [Rhizobiales bacterium]|uniref:FkbM family methyltransferase n=1 Tax=Hongsoonwoonella zoysiae TaxID=2821844 RepID=UPI00155FC326|nr:FkbM family methyltransferase [Hongsoonwoonella zoysiae]NRG16586.1 FkbM family methyltransferase [Hongsoonwoonella zoysiae]
MSQRFKFINSFIKRTKSIQALNRDIEIIKRFISENKAFEFSIKTEDNTIFHLPNLFDDEIQKIIYSSRRFYEQEILESIEKYVPEDATILDIGANIGNHALYWARKSPNRKIVCFEPVSSTFEILKKNIEANNINAQISAHNFGVSDKPSKARIDRFSASNIGATRLRHDEAGELSLISIDGFISEENKIGMLKIDTEGFEVEVLKGADKTIERHKPIIFVETFANKFHETNKILKRHGYTLREKFPGDNFLYIHTG